MDRAGGRHLAWAEAGRKFKRDGGGPMLPHDLTIAVVGGLILWFGCTALIPVRR
jgi:ammonia channel protein AmtB